MANQFLSLPAGNNVLDLAENVYFIVIYHHDRNFGLTVRNDKKILCQVIVRDEHLLAETVTETLDEFKGADGEPFFHPAKRASLIQALAFRLFPVGFSQEFGSRIMSFEVKLAPRAKLSWVEAEPDDVLSSPMLKSSAKT